MATAEQLAEMRRVKETLELETQIAQLKSSLQLMGPVAESSLTESWGSLVSPIDFFTDAVGFGRRASAWNAGGSRFGLDSQPFASDESELARIRSAGRRLAACVPAAVGAMQHLTNYCVGTGFSYKVVEQSDIPDTVTRSVQEAVDHFLDHNGWNGDLEREVFLRCHRDGEAFLSLTVDSTDNIAVRLIEPELVTEPDQPRELDDWLGIDIPTSWSFGVHTPADDVQQVLGYHIGWSQHGADWDYLPVDRAVHIKLNVDRNIKRGLSDFYPVQPHLDGADKLLRNAREGAAVQSAIAFIREHVPGATPEVVEAVRSTNARGYRARIATPGGYETRYFNHYEPGTVLDVGHGLQYKPGPLGSAHAGSFIQVHQAVLRMIGSRWCMPEYMISGDASNGSYSSTLVAESPFVKACEAEQRFFRSRFREVLWKVLQLAYRSGAIRSEGLSFNQLRRSVRIQIEAPSVTTRDYLRETRARQIEAEAGVLSLKTWASETGRDFEIERLNQQAERPVEAGTNVNRSPT